MKPYVICHMNSSVDGRILGSRWRPAENRMPGLFERIHEELGGGSWLIGRVTGSEYAEAEAYPDHADPVSAGTLVRAAVSLGDAKAYGIALDAQGGDHLGAVRYWRRPGRRGADRAGLRRASGGSPPRRRLLHLRRRAGARSGIGAEVLNRELGIERLLLEGGGGSNGAFLRAGLIDEISLAICPAIDGAEGGAQRLQLQRHGCRRIGADHLDDIGEQPGAGGGYRLAPLSAPKRLIYGGGHRLTLSSRGARRAPRQSRAMEPPRHEIASSLRSRNDNPKIRPACDEPRPPCCRRDQRRC